MGVCLCVVSAFLLLAGFGSSHLAYAFSIGAVVADAFCLLLLVIESIKDSQEEI